MNHQPPFCTSPAANGAVKTQELKSCGDHPVARALQHENSLPAASSPVNLVQSHFQTVVVENTSHQRRVAPSGSWTSSQLSITQRRKYTIAPDHSVSSGPSKYLSSKPPSPPTEAMTETHLPRWGIYPETRTTGQPSRSERCSIRKVSVVSRLQWRCGRKRVVCSDRVLTKKAHDPTNVDNPEAYSRADENSDPKPTAGQSVKPMPPIKFQNPTCQPSVLGAGLYLPVSVTFGS